MLRQRTDTGRRSTVAINQIHSDGQMNDRIDARKIMVRMQQEAEDHIRSTKDFRPAEELRKMFGAESGWQEQLQRWKQDRQIFSIEDSGQELFPMYAFDQTHDFRPCEALARVIDILGSCVSAWGLAFWFAGVNSFLDDQCPKDLLTRFPSWVIEAAQDEANEIEHG